MRHDTRARATSRAGDGVGDARVEALEPRRLFSTAVAAGLSDTVRTLIVGTTFSAIGPVVSVGHHLVFRGYQPITGEGADWAYDSVAGGPAARQAGRAESAAVAVGSKAILAGGLTLPTAPGDMGFPAIDDVQVFDDATGQWSPAVGHLSTARGDVTGVTVGSQALFAGGLYYRSEGGGEASSDVDVYDASTGAWTTTRLPVPIVAEPTGKAVTVGGKAIFVTPDPNRSGAAGMIAEIYDAATGQWSTAPLVAQEYGHGLGPQPVVAAAGHYAVFAGATTTLSDGSWRDATTVDVYDDAIGQWSTANLSQRRSGISTAVVNGVAIFAGGRYVDRHYVTHPSRVVDLFDGATGRWSTSVAPEPLVSGDGLPLDGVAVGGQAVFAGASGDALVYNVASGQWSTVRLAGTASVQAVANVEGAAYLIGPRGPDTVADVLDDVASISAPSDPRPADGSVRGTGAATFRWSGTPTAVGYDVYLDGRPAASGLAATRWSAPALSAGPHAWQVVARLADGSTLSGATWSFSAVDPVAQPLHRRRRLDRLRMDP